jgi:hypothetical protein
MTTLPRIFNLKNLPGLSRWLLLCGVIALIGCSSTSNRNRGSLSEAVKKSSHSYKGERKVRSSRVSTNRDKITISANRNKVTRTIRKRKPPKVVVSAPVMIDVHPEHRPPIVYERPKPNPNKGFFGLSFFSSVLHMGHLPNEAGGTITFGAYNGLNRHSLGLGFGFFPLTEENYLYGSLVNPGQVHFAYQYRRYTGFGFPMRNLYAKLEVAPQVRFWNYRNPIYSDITDEYGDNLGTEIITGDGLTGCAIGTGLGFSLIKSRHFEIGLDGTVGFNLLNGETTQGFLNDMFYNELFMKMSVEFAFK